MMLVDERRRQGASAQKSWGGSDGREMVGQTTVPDGSRLVA